MDTELEQLYPWTTTEGRSSAGSFTLCLEAPGAWSAEFALTVLLAQLLREKDTSCTLLCANHDRKHYDIVLRKQV